jgi:hypothetical protein
MPKYIDFKISQFTLLNASYLFLVKRLWSLSFNVTPVAARSKALGGIRPLACWNCGFDPAVGMDVSLL